MTIASVRITFGTANLGRGVDADEFTANLTRLLDAAEKAAGPAILALQEIDEADAPDEHRILAEESGARFAIRSPLTAAPILVQRRLRVIRSRTRFASPGLARVTPHRVVTLTVVELPGIDWLPRIVALNTHLPRDLLSTRGRRAMVRARLRAAATWHVIRGRIVVWMADTNTHGTFPQMMPREHTIGGHGIDLIRLSVPRGIKATVIKQRRINLSIDGHDAHLSTVNFQPRHPKEKS